MQSKSLLVALVVSTALTTAGCDRIKKLVGGKPSGQVVATVNGNEITSLELRQEMGNFSSRDPKVMKAAQQQALQQIILRNLLADKAKADKLDKTTDYTLQVRRGERTLLAQMYERKLAAGVKTPTKADAEAYVSSHPDQFANRRMLILDQVITGAGKITPEKFAPLKTLEDVKALLDSEGAPYQENTAGVDTLSADPNTVAQISKLPPGEVFVIPQGGAIVFNRISQTRLVPFKGELATNYAMQQLRQKAAQDTVRTQVLAMRKAAEPQIVYSAGYKPPEPTKAKPAAPAAAAAPAPAAAPATK